MPATPQPTDLRALRVALVHDWFNVNGGAERVIDQILTVVPHAELFALVCAMPGEPKGTYRGRPVTRSFIERLPLGLRRYRAYLPLFPFAIEQFDLSAFDIVISSSSSVAKGVLTGPDQLHLCYCYSPMRYAWDLQHQYLQLAGLQGVRGWPARALLHWLRVWDTRTAHGVDQFVTLSEFVARRIRKSYGRTSTVVHPPVDVAKFTLGTGPRAGFVTASRMVPYKQMPLIVRAFAAMPDYPLTVIGDGPDFAACQRAAEGHSHIRVLGHQPDAVLREEFSRAEAFVFAAEEDFGIAPLEAQACGTPVIALGRGGSLETIIDGQTGVLFPEATEASLQAAVRQFRAGPTLSAELCRRNAERFVPEQFRARFTTVLHEAWHALDTQRRAGRALQLSE